MSTRARLDPVFIAECHEVVWLTWMGSEGVEKASVNIHAFDLRSLAVMTGTRLPVKSIASLLSLVQQSSQPQTR
jgi:hypothetical protein